MRGWLLIAWSFGFLSAGLVRADPPVDADFFEARIRPILVEHCHRCHAGDPVKVKAGLAVDSRDGLLRGGDLGPAIVPGQPGKSLLLEALKQTGELKMPPAGPLPASAIDAVERWIAAGAPFPARVARKVPIPQEPAKPWALQPIRSPALPRVQNAEAIQTRLDAFVLARLEAQGLTFAPRADRRTLLRRLSYDLIGLPPTHKEIEAFQRDEAPDAYARQVERLLASPRYGERWGRHWLDVARYADTKDGVLMFGDDRIRPFAYTYRDYVIRAWNEDRPFNRFLEEQLAADLISPPLPPERLSALGFLTLGRQFDNNVHDVIDDRIDTVTRGLLGLTVSCARCHDHKYDPIPMADYYALHGIFASSDAPLVPPRLEPGRRGPDAFEARYAALEKELSAMLAAQHRLLNAEAVRRIPDYLVKVATTPPDPMETAVYFLSLGPEELRPPLVARWRNVIAQRAKPDDPVFGPWHDLMATPESDFACVAPGLVQHWQERPRGNGNGAVNAAVMEALASATLLERADVARVYGQLLARAAKLDAISEHDRVIWQPLRALVSGPESPAVISHAQTRRLMSRADTDAFHGKLQELDRLAVKEPRAPARAVNLVESAEPVPARMLLRGNPGRPGETVPRRFLRILEGSAPKEFSQSTARWDLARAITDPANPLTSRVLVNRVWMHHFGEPLVDSPSDFGSRASPPTHPELLDFLASEFMRQGWSVKRLHREIVLSRTYQQSSQARPEAREIDPENRLLSRFQRRRLEFEAFRDTLLFVAGRLDGQAFGRPVDVVQDAESRRRTVYGLVDRQSLPTLFRVFDFASPDQTAERRPRTIVPQQALFGLNAPFVLRQARGVIELPSIQREQTPAGRVIALFHQVLGRHPQPAEVGRALQFLDVAAQDATDGSMTAWEQLAQVLLNLNELAYVD